jgi:hypothetical protein
MLRALEYLLVELARLPGDGPPRMRPLEEIDALLRQIGIPRSSSSSSAIPLYRQLCEEILAQPGPAALQEHQLLDRVRAIKYELGERYLDRSVIRMAIECVLLVAELESHPGFRRPPVDDARAGGDAHGDDVSPPSGPMNPVTASGALRRFRPPVEGPPLPLRTRTVETHIDLSTLVGSSGLGYSTRIPRELADQLMRLAEATPVESLEPEDDTAPHRGGTAHRAHRQGGPRSAGADGDDTLTAGLDAAIADLEAAEPRPAGSAAGKQRSRAPAPGADRSHPRTGGVVEGSSTANEEKQSAARASRSRGWKIWTLANLLLSLLVGGAAVLSPGPLEVERSPRYQAYVLRGDASMLPLADARVYQGTLILTASDGWAALPVVSRQDLVRHLARQLLGQGSIQRILLIDARGRRLASAAPGALEVMEPVR